MTRTLTIKTNRIRSTTLVPALLQRLVAVSLLVSSFLAGRYGHNQLFLNSFGWILEWDPAAVVNTRDTAAAAATIFENLPFIPEHDYADNRDSGHHENNNSKDSVNRKLQLQPSFLASNTHNSGVGYMSNYTREQLIIDVHYVDADFAGSESLLTAAVLEFVRYMNLTMTSHGCITTHSINCVYALQEGHFTIIAWPKHGTLLVDVLLFHRRSMIEAFDKIKTLLAIPKSGAGKTPHVSWKYKKRGEPVIDATQNNTRSTFRGFLDEAPQRRNHVSSLHTGVHKVDINGSDVFDHRSTKDTSSINAACFSGHGRLMFIDGQSQSYHSGISSYYEALVHPALITHPDPQKILVIGDRNGGTLKEILKYEEITEVVLLNADMELTGAGEVYLSGGNSCRHIPFGSESSFHDKRVKVNYVNPVEWLIDLDEQSDNFDVVIIDYVPGKSTPDATEVLLNDESFLEAVSDSLGSDGILVAQIGAPPSGDNSVDNEIIFNDLVEWLDEFNFNSVHEYEDYESRLYKSIRFLVALKSESNRARWYRNEAEINIELNQRLVSDPHGQSLLRFFDGATMVGFQIPSRATENHFCGRNPDKCVLTGEIFDRNIKDHPIAEFEVKTSTKGPFRGCFTKVDILQKEYLALENCTQQMFVAPTTYSIIDDMRITTNHDFIFVLNDGYIEGYGMSDNFFGLPSATVDATLLTFANHGCNGTNNVGERLTFNEATLEVGTPVSSHYDGGYDMFNPFAERHYLSMYCLESTASVDINAGEEIFDNYLTLAGDHQHDFDLNLEEIKGLCSGSKGLVSLYEEKLQKTA